MSSCVSSVKISTDKQALLVGLNYTGTSSELHGCINDVINISQILQHNNYTTQIMTDTDISKKSNILSELEKLIKSGKKKLFFHYSGHGTQIYDTNGDEADHLDEALCEKDTLISDDQLNAVLSHMSEDQEIICLIDACHSGTIVDLPYILSPNKKVITNKTNSKIKGKVICISGCKDNQTSADVYKYGTYFGAMTNQLSILLKNGVSEMSWKELTLKLQTNMRLNRYDQIPQLTCSHLELFESKINL